ncbi:mitochondrial K+-H+ exchange-related-domain-containing protein [Aspergillus varians]
MTLRLFVVPISTRRALIYARLLRKDVSKERSILDRITDKAAETWAKWEEADKGWKMHLVSWGNRVQQRIPYEEWGLKSIPSLTSQRRIDESHGTKRVDVLFPGNAIKEEKLLPMLHKLSKERQELHRRRMWWSFIAAPLTAPVALIPLIPNIPFFYLVYRGWSHWRALNGSKHLQFLVEKNLLNPISHPGLVGLYAKRVSLTLAETNREDTVADMVENVEKSDERILLRMKDAKKLATILDAPGLALEAERAILQVSEQLESPDPSQQEKGGANTSEKKQSNEKS